MIYSLFFFWAQVAATGTLTPEIVAGLRTVVEARISPDGQHFAYVLDVPRSLAEDEDGASYRELHLSDGTTSRPFISGKQRLFSLQWDQNGRGLFFLAKRGDDKHTALYRIAIDGGEAVRVEQAGAAIQRYEARAGILAYISDQKEDAGRKKEAEKGFTREIYEEELRQALLFWRPIDSKEATALELPGSAFDLAIHPKGTHFAVVLAPSQLVDDSYMRKRIHLVDRARGQVVAHIENPGKLGKIAWSEDGQHLLAISASDVHDPREGRLLVADLAGNHKFYFEEFPGDVADFWPLNGNRVALLMDEGVSSSLIILNLANDKTEALIPPGNHSLDNLSADGNGKRFAFTQSSPEHPAELVSFAVGGRLQRLSRSNEVLGSLSLARQEVISYKARDGQELQGMLIHPCKREEAKRVPLILVVHGGPEAHYRNGWLTGYSSPGQMAAARGMAVFYPNYRGSTGRGRAFAKLSQGDPAGKEFDDLVDGVDHLISMGLVDAALVGVTGGSYGGYATAWCSTRYSDRFAAGVMFVGISNKTSKSGTTDIPDEEFLVHALRRTWDSPEDWQFFLERSPVYHAGKHATPLLILHGKSDPRVHPSQSLELYRQLKVRNQAPVRLVFYPGEGHGNTKAAARYDYNLRMLQWFEHYLQGQGGPMPEPALDYGAILGNKP